MVVVDASVILKWLLADPAVEPETERATDLMQSIVAGELTMLQPVHWLAEVAAVLVRIAPDSAPTDIAMLHAMELPTTDDAEVLQRACALSVASRQHVFDTLYHAVALVNEGATLITADERYRVKVQEYGKIVALRDWVPAA
jgi:predicted nucleic acid-binding protein